MATLEEKQETARENGKKSHGPVTKEGKARSAKNALTHGLTSKCVVMAWESEEKYAKLLKTYVDQWQPQNESEYKLVLFLTNADWRIHRIWSLEAGTWDSEIFIQSNAFEDAWTTFSPGMRTADACCGILASNPAILQIIPSYEQRFEASFYRALNALQKIRRQRGLKPIENVGLRRPFPSPTPTAPAPQTETAPPAITITTWLTLWFQFLLSLLQPLLERSVPSTAKKTANTTENTPEPTENNTETVTEKEQNSNEPTVHTSTHGDNSEYPADYSWFSVFTPTPRRPERTYNE